MSPEIKVLMCGRPVRELIEEIEEREPLRFLRSNFQTHPLHAPKLDKHKCLHDHREGKQVRGA